MGEWLYYNFAAGSFHTKKLLYIKLYMIEMPRPTARTTPNRSSDGCPHWLQWRAPKCAPKAPFSVDRLPNPASSLNPADLRCQTASGSDPPFFHNALVFATHRATERSRKSLTTIVRSAQRATPPNNNTNNNLIYKAPVCPGTSLVAYTFTI